MLRLTPAQVAAIEQLAQSTGENRAVALRLALRTGLNALGVATR